MNAAASAPLIALENVNKVFYTDEVETHALDNINLVIAQGELPVWPSPDHPGAASPRSSRSSACWTHRPTGCSGYVTIGWRA